MIETERLVLRAPVTEELPWLLEHMNTPAVMRYLAGVRSAEQVAEGLAADIAAFAGSGYRRWTIWRRADDCRIGKCGLFDVYSDAAPAAMRGGHEIGWSLAEECWGQGYATEAANAVLAFGFATLGYPVIFAQTSDSNQPSTRMMIRLGFARCPELDYVDPDYPPEDNPTVVYRLDRDAWEARP